VAIEDEGHVSLFCTGDQRPAPLKTAKNLKKKAGSLRCPPNPNNQTNLLFSPPEFGVKVPFTKPCAFLTGNALP
jgi:hypothetical protein